MHLDGWKTGGYSDVDLGLCTSDTLNRDANITDYRSGYLLGT